MKWANLHVNIPRVVAYRPVFDAMDVQTASMDLMKVDAVSKNNLSNKLIIGQLFVKQIKGEIYYPFRNSAR